MKPWLLAGLFTLATIPLAHASEAAVECGLETPQLLREVTALSVEASVAAPSTRKAAADDQSREQAANAGAAATESAAPRPTPRNERRRRGGSLTRVPDAMLIDGRGVL